MSGEQTMSADVIEYRTYTMGQNKAEMCTNMADVMCELIHVSIYFIDIDCNESEPKIGS